jgi:RHH-type rel operon transcriptional repressor/antitoxin RelB
MLAIRLPEEIERRLSELARNTGRTKTYYAREAIERYLEDMEDVYQAEAVLERVRQGKEGTYTLDELERRRALED